MNTFINYLKSISDDQHRAKVTDVLDWVSKSFPHLEAKIAWNQPMFTDHGTFIVGFSAAKQHFSISPEKAGIEKFSEEIASAGYSHTSNLFRIKWNQDVDFSLLARIIRYNIEEKADYSSFWRK